MNTLIMLAAFVGPAELSWLGQMTERSPVCYVCSDLALLEETESRPFTIHKLPIPALHQVVTERICQATSMKKGEEEYEGALQLLCRISILPTRLS